MIAEDYSKETRAQLQRIPVWEPGGKVRPGDFGRFKQGVFYRGGSLADIRPDIPLKVAKAAVSNDVFFTSSKGFATRTGLETPAVGVSEAHLRLIFSRVGSTIVHGSNTAKYRIDNLFTVLTAIPQGPWDDRDALITEVESAERFAVLCSASKHWEVDVGGGADVLSALQIAQAGVMISSRAGAGYSKTGTGPLLLTAYANKGILGKEWKPLEADDEPVPLDRTFEEIGPSDPFLIQSHTIDDSQAEG